MKKLASTAINTPAPSSVIHKRNELQQFANEYIKDTYKKVSQRLMSYIDSNAGDIQTVPDLDILYTIVLEYENAENEKEHFKAYGNILWWFALFCGQELEDQQFSELLKSFSEKENFKKTVKEIWKEIKIGNIQESIKNDFIDSVIFSMKDPHLLLINEDISLVSENMTLNLVEKIRKNVLETSFDTQSLEKDLQDDLNIFDNKSFQVSDYESYFQDNDEEISKINDFFEKGFQILLDNVSKKSPDSYGKITHIKKQINDIKAQAENLYFGFYPIGLKVHFIQPLSEEKITKLNEIGLSANPFKLMNADTCLVFPACQSSEELIGMLYKLIELEIFNESEDPVLQGCISGRLPNELAGVLASSTIFSSPSCLTYPEDAFKTTHDHSTGSMMMLYDAGIYDNDFPFLPPDIEGRTDIHSRRNINDIKIYHFIGNLVSQSYYGGMFEELGKSFVTEYKELLETYDFEDILEKKWIFDEGKDKEVTDEQAKEHYNVIKKCTDCWFSDFENKKETGLSEGLRYDVLKLLTKYMNLVKIRQSFLKKELSDTPLNSLKKYNNV